MDPHVFDHLDPDLDPQKICGSRIRIQGYQIDQNRQKSFKEIFTILLKVYKGAISHKLMNGTNFPS